MSHAASNFISVVVPCYNAIGTIDECLASLARQTYPKAEFEIIAVDNNSTDGTPGFIATRFPEVKLLSSSDPGSGFARNVGFRAARGALILSLDADCVADSNWIEVMAARLLQAPTQIAAIGGRIEPYSLASFAEKYQPTWISQESLRTDKPIKYAETPNAGFRAEAARRIGWFDGSAGHDDADMGIRLRKAGFEVEYEPGAIVRHRNPRNLGEIYQQRYKYAIRNFTLSLKHPEMFENPLVRGRQNRLLAATIRRVLGDLLLKLPLSLAGRLRGQPRGWPFIDAIGAIGNYNGFRRALVDYHRTP